RRDQAIDLVRGAALVTIFVNHVPGTVFERLTHRNFGLSDATEVFVLLAGYAAALAYGRDFEGDRGLALSLKSWSRAAQIYV
ncbi:OpgC domain-containing protein, partial [Acinetobacter baumannii]